MSTSSTAEPGATRPSRRWRILAFIGLLLLALFLMLLPELLRLGLQRFAPDIGLGEVQLERVGLNFLTAELSLQDVRIRYEEQPEAKLQQLLVDLSWSRLFKGEVYLDALSIQGLQLGLRETTAGQWTLVPAIPLASAQTSPQAEEQPVEEEPSEQGLPKLGVAKVSLLESQLRIDSPKITGVLHIDALSLDKLSTWEQEPIRLDLQAAWDEAPLALQMTLEPWVDTPKLSGALQLKRFALASIDLQALGQQEVLEQLALRQGQFSTDLNFEATQVASGLQGLLKGELQLDDLLLDYRQFELRQQQLAWQVEGDWSLASKASSVPQINLSSELQQKQFTLHDQKSSEDVLHWASLQLKGIRLSREQQLQLESLNLSDLQLLGAEFKTAGIDAEQFSYLPSGQVALNKLTVKGGDYQLLFEPDGLQQVNQLQAVLKNLLPAESSPAEPSDETIVAHETVEAEDNKDATALQFSLNEFALSDSKIKLVDKRFAEAPEQKLNIKSLTARDLSQRQPQQSSHFQLDATVGDFAPLKLEGQAKPFADMLWLQAEGSLKGLELPDLSPYSKAYLGYEVTRGHYDHSFDVKLADEQMKVVNKLRFRQLKLAAKESEKPLPLQQYLDMPLNVALNMLRDKEDTIKLEVPISGRLDDPNIEVQRIINEALGTALKKGATSYLIYAIQPYGSLLLAADIVGDQLKTINFEPMTFSPGSAEPGADQGDYQAKLQALLTERPALTLNLCGRSNALDAQQLFGVDAETIKAAKAEQPVLSEEQRAQLLALAQQRAKHLKAALIGEEIGADRLLLCKSEYAAKAEAAVLIKM